jgi:hypothetical protein
MQYESQYHMCYFFTNLIKTNLGLWYINFMSKREKLLNQILRGTSDSNISFKELCSLLQFLGFSVRIKGSHHIFWRDDIIEIINIQPLGAFAKPYQVKQIRELLIKYHMEIQHNDKV